MTKDAGFVVDLPPGFVYDENWSCYVSSANPDLKIWPGDGSLFETKENFADAMAQIPGGGEAEEYDLSGYKLYLIEEPESFYGKATHFFADFGGRYADYYGGKIYVTHSTDISLTKTPDMFEMMKTFRKAGDPVLWDPNEPAETSTATEEGEPKSALEDFRPDYKPEDTAAMSNFMANGQYAVSGERMYGLGFDSDGNANFVLFDLKEEGDFLTPENPKIIEQRKEVYYVTPHGEEIYYLLADEGVYKVSADGENPEKVIPEAFDYFQIVGDRAFFCNDSYRFCSSNLDGTDVQVLVDKEVYYTYMIDRDWLIYQDDADGESLHLRHLPSDTDVKLSDGVSENPILAGSSLYFTKGGEGDKHLARIDLEEFEIQYDEAKKDFDYRFNEEVSDKKSPANFAISCSGMIYNGGETGYALEDWEKLELSDKAEKTIYKFLSPGSEVYWIYNDKNEVESIYLLSAASGGAKTLPRFD